MNLASEMDRKKNCEKKKKENAVHQRFLFFSLRMFSKAFCIAKSVKTIDIRGKGLAISTHLTLVGLILPLKVFYFHSKL